MVLAQLLVCVLQLGPKLAVAIFMLFKPYCVTAKNVTGVYYDQRTKTLKIYNRYGKQIGTSICNYGDAFKIKGKFYGAIAKGQLINPKEF